MIWHWAVADLVFSVADKEAILKEQVHEVSCDTALIEGASFFEKGSLALCSWLRTGRVGELALGCG